MSIEYRRARFIHPAGGLLFAIRGTLVRAADHQDCEFEGTTSDDAPCPETEAKCTGRLRWPRNPPPGVRGVLVCAQCASVFVPRGAGLIPFELAGTLA